MNSESETELDTQSTKPDTGETKKSGWFRQSFNPFRIATLRGLAVLLPPLLTIMLFVWAWNTIERAVLRPVEALSSTSLAYLIEDVRENKATIYEYDKERFFTPPSMERNLSKSKVANGFPKKFLR